MRSPTTCSTHARPTSVAPQLPVTRSTKLPPRPVLSASARFPTASVRRRRRLDGRNGSCRARRACSVRRRAHVTDRRRTLAVGILQHLRGRTATFGAAHLPGWFRHEAREIRSSAIRRHETTLRRRCPRDTRQRRLHGPSATTQFRGSVPNSRTIAPIIAGSTPSATPRQPAWAAPMDRVVASNVSAGRQSAVAIASVISRRRVISASPDGRSSTVVLWNCCSSVLGSISSTSDPCTWRKRTAGEGRSPCNVP